MHIFKHCFDRGSAFLLFFKKTPIKTVYPALAIWTITAMMAIFTIMAVMAHLNMAIIMVFMGVLLKFSKNADQ